MTPRLPTFAGFDFHCHVDLHQDPKAIIARCEAERVFTIAVTTTPKAYPTNAEWTGGSSYVVPAVGLHPEVAGERFHELPLLLSTIRQSAFVGEVGLDGSPQHKRYYPKQLEVFSQTLQAAQSEGGKVITIHSRRAVRDVIDLIEKLTTPDRVLCILHWFSGSRTEMNRAAEIGCYFSVNASMLNNEKAEPLLAAMPMDRILTETDAPFGQTEERASVPWDAVRTARRLAARYRSDQSLIRENAVRVLRFAGVAE
jgi:TatD DNase family protein